MDIFEQMTYFVRNLQLIDIFLKYQNKKFDYIPLMIFKNDQLELYHPFNPSITNIKKFAKKLIETNFNVSHHYVFSLDKNLRFNYKIDNVNNTFEKVIDLFQNKKLRNDTVIPNIIVKRFAFRESIDENKLNDEGVEETPEDTNVVNISKKASVVDTSEDSSVRKLDTSVKK